MKFKTSSLIVGLVLAFAGPGFAQDTQISGTVAKATGGPLPGAQVFVQGLQDRGVGTVTDQQGRFNLRIADDVARPGREVTLLASFLGYSTGQQELTLNGGTMNADFVLAQTALTMDEFVITGVVDPVQGKKLPFTVGKVSVENIQTVPATGAALTSLQGKVAGVNITRPTGQPGTEVSVQLRTPTSLFTDNEPLYVVDGVILGAGTVDIEALDIESIEVIKGAAAASLYGSRAAAGVIQITTARGQRLALDRTRFSFRSELGTSDVPREVPKLTVHHNVVHEGEPYTDQYGRLVRPGDRIDRFGNLGGGRRQGPNFFGFVNKPGQIADTPYKDPLFDHLDLFYRPGRFNTQSLTVSQNSDRTNFLASVNRYDEAGSVPNHEGFERYNARLNLDHRVMDNLTLSFSGYHNRSDRGDLTDTDRGIDERPSGSSLFFQLARYNPEVDISRKDAQGRYLQFPDSAFWQENPLFIQQARDFDTRRARTLGSFSSQYTPFAWLRLAGQFSYDRLDQNARQYIPAGTPINPFSGKQETFPHPGLLDLGETIIDTQNGSLSATLSKPFGDFNPRLTFAGTYENRDFRFVQTRGENFAVRGQQDVNLARERHIRSNIEQIKANGVFADLALDYAGRYIGSFLIRSDGSSLFGPEERWHQYYRAALAYRIAEEPWWPLKGTVTEFKPRFSVGTAGNRPQFDYQYETWNVGVSATGDNVTFSRGTLGNRFLSPEFARETEFGLDVAFLNRYLLQVTYADQRTEDLILRLPQPAVTGYQFQWNNVGALEGNTLEATLEATLVNQRNFNWTATAIWDRSESVISDWDVAPFRRGIKLYQEGVSPYDMYGSRFLTSLDELAANGVPAEFHDHFDVNDDGYVVYVGEGNTWRSGLETNARGRALWDTNATIAGQRYTWGWPVPQINPETGEQVTTKIGSMQPDFNYGFLSNMHYRGVSLHAHFRGQQGGEIYNYTRQRWYRLGRHGDIDQRGKPENEKKGRQYYVRGLFNDNIDNIEFVEDGSFLKLQALQLAYTFRQNQLQRFLGGNAPENLKVGLTGRNLFTLTDYKGYDPDVGNVLNRYDSFHHPNLRQITASVELTF